MEILKKNYKFISLGYNCCFKKYIQNKIIKQETQLFDYIGTPMWAINEIVENNFNSDELCKGENYQKIEIYEKSDKKILVNIKYFIRIIHEITDINDNLINQMKRRCERLHNIFKNTKKIIFLRYEEKMDKKEFPEYKEKYETKELDYIKQFANLIKFKYPQLEFKIIYVSITEDNNIFKEYNLLVINTKINIDYNNCLVEFSNLFNNCNYFKLFISGK